MTNVILVEDHSIIRQGIKMLLKSETEILVIAEAGNGEELKDVLAHIQPPDVIIMDISMPVMNGIEACRYVRQHYPETRILALTMHEKETDIKEILSAGATGYISKAADSKQLAQAIKLVAAGNSYICPEISQKLPDTKAGNIQENNN
ncbi:response regulator [Adhaeribacter aquaticus]|uniref:response regulator n=1 Tax=Adhaeribacter aquaticus TaxID=299567 RepID=UPI000424521A|nr:response regulator transcription factor [Adhaeribacter aquaticus]